MKYKVLETYTPHDQEADRSRRTAEFESDNTDIVELAYLARLACYRPTITPTTETNIRRALEQSDVAGQLEDQDVSGFEFLIFGNSGEWCLEVWVVE